MYWLPSCQNRRNGKLLNLRPLLHPLTCCPVTPPHGRCLLRSRKWCLSVLSNLICSIRSGCAANCPEKGRRGELYVLDLGLFKLKSQRLQLLSLLNLCMLTSSLSKSFFFFSAPSEHLPFILLVWVTGLRWENRKRGFPVILVNGLPHLQNLRSGEDLQVHFPRLSVQWMREPRPRITCDPARVHGWLRQALWLAWGAEACLNNG